MQRPLPAFEELVAPAPGKLIRWDGAHTHAFVIVPNAEPDERIADRARFLKLKILTTDLELARIFRVDPVTERDVWKAEHAPVKEDAFVMRLVRRDRTSACFALAPLEAALAWEEVSVGLMVVRPSFWASAGFAGASLSGAQRFLQQEFESLVSLALSGEWCEAFYLHFFDKSVVSEGRFPQIEDAYREMRSRYKAVHHPDWHFAKTKTRLQYELLPRHMPREGESE